MLQWSLANLLSWAAQVTAIVAAGLLLPALLRLRVPGARLILLRALLIVCVALPLIQPWAVVPAPVPDPFDIQAVESSSDAGITPAARTGAQPEGGPVLPPDQAQSWPWQRIAIGVLAAGIAARLGWLGIGLVSLMRLRRSSVVLEPQPETVEDAELAVGARASFRVSPRVERPVTFGLRHPVVLVPEGFLRFSPAEQSAIACHELLHVRRHDWLRTLAEEVICAILWFHPAIWWLIDQFHLSVEEVIDRHVVGLLGDRRSYLQALLRLASSGRQPNFQPAALFLKHGHLRQRVAMLIKETPMSRVRLAASFVVVLTMLACGGWLAVQAFPLHADAVAESSPATNSPLASVAAPPVVMMAPAAVSSQAAGAGQQSPPPVVSALKVERAVGQANVIRTVSMSGQADEATLVKRIQAAPNDVSGYFALARFYEESGRVLQAEEALFQARRVRPNDPSVYLQLGTFYNRQGLFDKTMEALTKRAALDPKNPEAYFTLASYYWDKAFRDSGLSESQKTAYIAKGMEAVDTALKLKSNYVEAVTYKGLLTQLQAGLEKDPARQKVLNDAATALRDQAKQLRAAQVASTDVPLNAVRVGGSIRPPTKIKDVKPVYPPVAQTARVQGVVIVEAVIGEDGHVGSVRVLRSIPLLDQAAIEAVRQWEFSPTLLNTVPVPVIMTMTVNFTLGNSVSVGGMGGGGGRGGVSGGVSGGVAGGIGGGVSGGVVGGVVGSGPVGGIVSDSRIPPPPPPPPLPPGTVRIGGTIKPPTKLVDVKPVYPPDAKDARIQGVVIIEATIDTDGKVINARVLRSIAQLDQAALDAVNQWEFSPTTVDGVAMKVIMTVTVNFTLQ